MKTPDSRQGTRDRILEAAGEAFASRGYEAVTVREICGKAGVNVAAINYHFKDKEGLYKAVVKRWQQAAYEKYPPVSQEGVAGVAGGPDDPERRLREFIRSFLFRMLDEGKPSWFGKFVAREFIEPSPARDILIEDTIRPSYVLLSSTVKEMLGEGANDETVSLCSASVIGQCLYFHNARPVMKRISEQHTDPAEIERIAEHIASFSITAIRGLKT